MAGLPVTARCELRETDADGVDGVVVTVDDGEPVAVAQGEPVAVRLGPAGPSSATVENIVHGGRLAVRKTVTGAAEYGGGPFRIETSCRHQGEVLLEEAFELVAGLLGIDTSAYSVGYVAGWTDGDTELIRRTAENVLSAVHTLADGLMGTGSEDGTDVAA